MSRGLTARGWLRTLWLWWGILAVGGAVLVALAFFNSSLFQLRTQEVELQPRIQALKDDFVPLRERLVGVPLSLLTDFEQGQLSLDRLRAARVQGEPFLKLYVVDAAGKKVFAGDRGDDLPAWLLPLGKHYDVLGRGIAPMRPHVPSYDPPGTPPAYLAYYARNARGQQLFSQVDLDYLFGPWLRERLKAHHLGEASTRVLSQAETVEAVGKPSEAVTGHSRIMGSEAFHSAWRFRIPTFFPDDKQPFQQVRLEVDAYPGLHALTRTYGAVLGALALILGSFALCLRIAGRAVGRELDLAKARSNFTAMVSHELKTPVAAIRLYGEILVNKLVDDPAKVDEYHQTIMDEAARLQRLIENLLDLGKIERGARTYELADLPVAGLVDEAVAQALAATPAASDHTLVRDDGAALPAIRADQDAARQAIANLVHNALKYGGKPANVTVATRREGEWVLVEVLDRGPGIPLGRRTAIFEPYVRLEEDEARRETQGTGLGLALVKGYVEGQGGRVTVDDRPGGGSCFRLYFKAAMTKT